VVSWADATLWGYTVVACTSADASVTHEHALETRESSCMATTAKHFIIFMVHSLSGAVGHMTAPELPSQEGRARSPNTRDNTEAPLSERQSPEH
jgi:hypothetical protein